MNSESSFPLRRGARRRVASRRAHSGGDERLPSSSPSWKSSRRMRNRRLAHERRTGSRRAVSATAQFAVKQAKVVGSPQVYEPRQATEARRRFSIETELRRALDKDQLRLFYQPLINLKSGEVAGFGRQLSRVGLTLTGEKSVQRVHSGRRRIGPDFICSLGAGRWTRPHKPWRIGIGQPASDYRFASEWSLSAIQVARDDIAAVVASALKSSGLTGDRLTLELTESSIVQDPVRATRVFDALKALDATVAMDDSKSATRALPTCSDFQSTFSKSTRVSSRE